MTTKDLQNVLFSFPNRETSLQDSLPYILHQQVTILEISTQ